MLTVCDCRTLRMRNLASNWSAQHSTLPFSLSLSIWLQYFMLGRVTNFVSLLWQSQALWSSYPLRGNRERKCFREFQVTRAEKGRGGEGKRWWGNCLVCKRITSHMLCHKKINNVMTNVWQICQHSNSHAYARAISLLPPFSLPRSVSLCRLLCVQYAWYARHVVYLCLPHTPKLRLFFG